MAPWGAANKANSQKFKVVHLRPQMFCNSLKLNSLHENPDGLTVRWRPSEFASSRD